MLYKTQRQIHLQENDKKNEGNKRRIVQIKQTIEKLMVKRQKKTMAYKKKGIEAEIREERLHK